jgi:hypothetical protein
MGSGSETTNNINDLSNTQKINETNIISENGFEIPLTDLLIKYRETFLNIDMQIINDLKPCFMQIY